MAALPSPAATTRAPTPELVSVLRNEPAKTLTNPGARDRGAGSVGPDGSQPPESGSP